MLSEESAVFVGDIDARENRIVPLAEERDSQFVISEYGGGFVYGVLNVFHFVGIAEEADNLFHWHTEAEVAESLFQFYLHFHVREFLN